MKSESKSSIKVAIYLRVSTLDQANRGNTNRDGFSIPAQREACIRKAESLEATDIKEYTDRGESARTTARPALQRLLGDLGKKKNFDYVIVHKLDRLARSTFDDVAICFAIKESGAQLVSVTENIDNTPSGGLMHGIMAAIAEFYSRNLAAEALKGAVEKAKQGGTPYMAPIGYTNIIERTNHRENRTVILDSERAPLVTWGLERYSTGDYSKVQLREELMKRGLKNRPNANKPISLTSLDRMLSNRYYLGYVNYCGVEYKGNHQPLVTPAVFAAAQAVRLAQNYHRGKSQKHFHYLSRLLVCERCHRHLCFAISKHRYPYFFCINRRDTGCEQPYIPLTLIEVKIIDAFKQMNLSKNDHGELAFEIGKELKAGRSQAEDEIKRQKQRINRLEIEQENLLQAYYNKIIEPDLMKKEQGRLSKEIKLAQTVISDSEKRLSIINNRRDRALEIADSLDIGRTFLKANPVIKRHFCQALFSEIAVNDQPNGQMKTYWWIKEHHVTIKVNWHNPINIRHITEAILALSLERSVSAANVSTDHSEQLI
jgi:DNA invertase Pin-like site-specific DNA recombinase